MPSFDPDVTEYSVTTPNGTETVTVSLKSGTATAETYYHGDPMGPGTEWELEFEEGENEFFIHVEDGNYDEGTLVEQDYSVTVTRQA